VTWASLWNVGGTAVTKEDLDGDRVFLVRDFLSPAECVSLVARSERMEYEPGTVADAVVENVRSNERVIFDDPSLAADLFARAAPFLPPALDGSGLVGFNERFRFYRYGPGQTFKPHRDGAYHRFERLEQSHLTFMVYLNEGAAGGETRFFAGLEQAFRGEPYLSVRPATGAALVFVHRVWHEGAVVREGLKYVLRTDVMYGRGLS
jgi:prolyl 4-hydroxylase